MRRNPYPGYCRDCRGHVPPQGGRLAGKYPSGKWQILCDACAEPEYEYSEYGYDPYEYASQSPPPRGSDPIIDDLEALIARLRSREAMRPHCPPCFVALGLTPPVSGDDVRRAYREKAQAAHPDRGGTNEAFVALKKARDEALALVGVGQ